MTLYERYQSLMEIGTISRGVAAAIDKELDGSLSDEIPLGSFTAMESDVNYDKIIKYLGDIVHVKTVIDSDIVLEKLSKLDNVTNRLAEVFSTNSRPKRYKDALKYDKVILEEQVEVDNVNIPVDHSKSPFSAMLQYLSDNSLSDNAELILVQLNEYGLPPFMFDPDIEYTFDNVFTYYKGDGVDEYIKVLRAIELKLSDDVKSIELTRKEYYALEIGVNPSMLSIIKLFKEMLVKE